MKGSVMFYVSEFATVRVPDAISDELGNLKTKKGKPPRRGSKKRARWDMLEQQLIDQAKREFYGS